MHDDDAAGVNSEMRYITLELMKISERRKKPFAKVAREYISNVYRLRRLIKSKAGEELVGEKQKAGVGGKRL